MAIRRVGRPSKADLLQLEIDKQDEINGVLNASPALDPALFENVEEGTDPTMETDNYVEAVPDDNPVFTDPDDEQLKENIGNTTGLQEPYKDSGFSPAIETSRDGFKGQDSKDQLNKQIKNEPKARPANTIDLEHLDESMIMNMPEIKAVSYELIDMLNPKPKDKAIRFRWTNYKNAVAGNLGRLIALGYEYATPDDIDTTKYKLDPSMVEGKQVRYYDVVLLKINVIRLMQLYKSNIIRSVMKLANAQGRGMKEANRQFNADLASNPNMVSRYNQAKMQNNGREPIEFYTPGMEESAVVK